MKKILTGALAALTVGGALAASAVPAAADDHHGHGGWHGGGYRGGGWHGGYRGGDWGRHDGGFNAGAAALLGLAAGAAIAGGGAYYANPYPPAYYAPVPRCRVEMRWNPYWGGYDRVRVCY